MVRPVIELFRLTKVRLHADFTQLQTCGSIILPLGPVLPLRFDWIAGPS